MKILLFASHLLASSLSAIPTPELTPQIKTADRFDWPVNFRVPEFPEERIPTSASGQFSAKEYARLAQDYKNLIVVDLRREFHGFVDGYPISWKLTEPGDSAYGYNEGLSSEQIEAGEKDLLNQMTGYKTVQTERELVEQSGGRYIRFPISDYSFPKGEEVDLFIELLRSLGKDSWIHFHCAGGSGRTTTLLSMVDMMQNSRSLSSDEILHRQGDICCGAKLYDPEIHYADQPARIEGAIERYRFLQSFHQYCLENPDFSQSWTSWSKEK